MTAGEPFGLLLAITRAEGGALITGTVCWGHVTGVSEDNVRTFSAHWTGTGTIVGSGDSEYVDLTEGANMVSEIVNTGEHHVTLTPNVYVAGDTPTIEYRHAATEIGVASAIWTTYVGAFLSLGYVQVRISN